MVVVVGGGRLVWWFEEPRTQSHAVLFRLGPPFRTVEADEQGDTLLVAVTVSSGVGGGLMWCLVVPCLLLLAGGPATIVGPVGDPSGPQKTDKAARGTTPTRVQQ